MYIVQENNSIQNLSWLIFRTGESEMKKFIVGAAVSATVLALGGTLTYAAGVGPIGPGPGPKGLPGVNQMLTTLTQAVQTLEQQVVAIAGQLQGLGPQVALIQNNQNQQQASISTLQTTSSTDSAQLSADQQQFVQQQSQIALLQQTVTEQSQEIQKLQQEIGQTNTTPTQPSQATTYSVEGTMVDANGQPFFSPIYLVSTGGVMYHSGAFDASSGAFSWTDIPSGTYSVRFGMPEFTIASPLQVVVNGSDVSGLTFKLATPVYNVSGNATANGQPIANQMITLEVSNGTYGGYWGNTDSEGNFTIHGLPNGTYGVVIGASGAPLASGEFTVSNGNLTGMKVGN